MTTDTTWTLEELSHRAQDELERRNFANPGGRVAAVPNARTIRYYTTLGLVDRPSSYEAGVARYGPRHLLQLLAIKALQAEFLPLPEVQRRLYGRSENELQQVIEAATRPLETLEANQGVRTWLASPALPGLTLVVEDREKFLDFIRSHRPEEAVERLKQAFDALIH